MAVKLLARRWRNGLLESLLYSTMRRSLFEAFRARNATVLDSCSLHLTGHGHSDKADVIHLRDRITGAAGARRQQTRKSVDNGRKFWRTCLKKTNRGFSKTRDEIARSRRAPATPMTTKKGANASMAKGVTAASPAPPGGCAAITSTTNKTHSAIRPPPYAPACLQPPRAPARSLFPHPGAAPPRGDSAARYGAA